MRAAFDSAGDANRSAALPADGVAGYSSGSHTVRSMPDTFDDNTCRNLWRRSAVLRPEFVDGSLAMTHRLHSCSRVGCAFSLDHLTRFRYALSSLIRRTGMPERTLPTLFRELRPPNLTSENFECARLRDPLRIHFADLEFGIVFHCSTAGIAAVWKWNLH